MAKKQKLEEPTKKTIETYALAVEKAIGRNPDVKRKLQADLKRFCDAVERRFEIIRPVCEEAKKRKKISIPARIRNILKKPESQRNRKEEKLIKQFEETLNNPGNPPGEGFKLGSEWICSQYINGYREHFAVRCWLPVEPPNPFGWFPGFDDSSWYTNYFDSLTKEQENIRNAVVLSVVHDYGWDKGMRVKDRIIFKGTKYTGRYFRRDEFILDLWRRIHYPELWERYRHILEAAGNGLKTIETTGGQKKRSDEEIKRIASVYEDEYEKTKDSKGSWDKIARIYGWNKWGSARKHVERRLKDMG